MPPPNVTITSLTPVNVVGGVPGGFTVEGTVTGCEILYVTSSCSDKPAEYEPPTGATHTWSVHLDNGKGCVCGQPITVTASCVLGFPEDDSKAFPLQIVCDSCPTISPPTVTVGGCVGGNRQVTLSAQVTVSGGTPAAVYWDFGDGTFGQPTSVAAGPPSTVSATHAYPPPGPYTAKLMVFMPSGCPAQQVVVGPLQPCTCPPGEYLDSATGNCVACPTTLTLQAPSVTGCAGGPGGASATAGFTAAPPPGMTASQYLWSVTAPGGKKADRASTSPSVDTTSGWTGPGATSGGAVDLSQPGAYSVAVTAKLAGDAAPCSPVAGQPFQVGPCACPQKHVDPTKEWSVTNITAPFGPSTFETVTCDTATVTIDFALDKGAFSDTDLRYQWDFGDGATAGPLAGPAGAKQTHTFTNVGQTKTYTVVVTVSVPGSTCPPVTRQMQLTVPACPPGPDPGPEPEPEPEVDKPGRVSLCDVLLGLWLALFVAAGIAFYFNANKVGIALLILWALAFAVWIAVCCWPCARTFWRCCTLLQWLLLATLWLLQIFAVIAIVAKILSWLGFGFPALNPLVPAIYTFLGLTLLALLLSSARCRFPNPWNPKDWPGSRC